MIIKSYTKMIVITLTRHAALLGVLTAEMRKELRALFINMAAVFVRSVDAMMGRVYCKLYISYQL